MLRDELRKASMSASRELVPQGVEASDDEEDDSEELGPQNKPARQASVHDEGDEER